MIRVNVGTQKKHDLASLAGTSGLTHGHFVPTGNRDQSLTMSTLFAGGLASLPRCEQKLTHRDSGAKHRAVRPQGLWRTSSYIPRD